MDKNQYFDECHFLVQDEKYILREQHSEDKNDYYNLWVETSLLAKRMSQTAFRDFFEKQWEQRSDEDAIYISVTKYHRTLTTYLNTLLSNGFIINHIVEPQPPEYMMDIPGMQDEMRRPMMLIVSANKKVDR